MEETGEICFEVVGVEVGGTADVGVSSIVGVEYTPEDIGLEGSGQAAGAAGFGDDVSAHLFVEVSFFDDADDEVDAIVEDQRDEGVRVVDVFDEELTCGPEGEVIFFTEGVEGLSGVTDVGDGEDGDGGLAITNPDDDRIGFHGEGEVERGM